MLLSCAALRASAETAPGSHLPAAAVESSRRHVLDRELADLAAGLLERELLAVDDRLRLRPRVALQRQARVDGQGGGAGAAAIHRRCSSLSSAAARGHGEGKSSRQAARGCHGTYSQEIPPQGIGETVERGARALRTGAGRHEVRTAAHQSAPVTRSRLPRQIAASRCAQRRARSRGSATAIMKASKPLAPSAHRTIQTTRPRWRRGRIP